jgi:hypothetical protein
VIVGLTGLTVFIEHGCIIDAAMLSLYITYNIWCISRSWKESFLKAVQFESFFNHFVFKSSIFPTNSHPILSAVTSLISMFSVEIVVHLMFQMCVFVLAVRFISQAINEYSGEEDDKNRLAYQDWIFNILWPSFGKLVLVIVYTYAWILHTRPDLVQSDWSWCNPITCRYINIIMVLLIYLKHLLTPIDEPVFKID